MIRMKYSLIARSSILYMGCSLLNLNAFSIKRIIWIILLIINVINIKASGLSDDTIPIIPTHKKSIPTQIDLSDVIRNITHINLRKDSTKQNGNGPFFAILPAAGYSLQSGWTAALTTSTSFYTDHEHSKISTVQANAFYSLDQQYWTIINTNVFLEKYKLHLFGDWRFYQFPTNTFGLGNFTTFNDILGINYKFIRFYQYVYRECFDNLFLGLGYALDNHWDIQTKADTGITYHTFINNQYGYRSVSSGFVFIFLYDNRSNSINPANGSYINIQYRPNMVFLGSNMNYQSALIDLREYIPFPSRSGNILTFWSYNFLTLKGRAPYLDMPSTGWDDYSNTGRGYVPGRYTGNNMVYLESEYRFQILADGFLGGVVFANGETMMQSLKSGIDRINPGYGLGIRIKMNKHSNTNLAIDYGFGVDGSKGFFFNLGEVF